MGSKENIYDRIEMILDYKKIKKGQLAKRLDISNGQISGMLKGSDFGISKLIAIVELFPEINGHWLLTGKGDILIKNSSQNQKELKSEIERLSRELAESQKDVIYLLRKLKELEAKEEKSNAIKHTA